MYRFVSFSDGYVRVTHTETPYDCSFMASSEAEGIALVISMNADLLTTRLSAIRYEREVGGIQIGGLRVLTDTTSQAKLTSAVVTLENNLVPDVDWKAVNGWSRVTMDTIRPVAKAVAAHSRACFRGERVVQEAIAAATTIEATEAIDVGRLFDKAYAEAFAEVMSPSETTAQATT